MGCRLGKAALGVTLYWLLAGGLHAEDCWMKGKITGEDGSPVRGALVKITRTDSRRKFEHRTHEDGTYNVWHVPPGTYRISVIIKGKERDARENVRCATDAITEYNFTVGISKANSRTNSSSVPQYSQDHVIQDFNFNKVDDLLDLGAKGIRMIVFRRLGGEEISSAHLARFRQWVEAGGVGYIAGVACHGALLEKLDIVTPTWFRIAVKETGEVFQTGQNSSSCLGELVVRGAVPYAAMANHKVTEGVSKLYVCGYPASYVQVEEGLDTSRTLEHNIWYKEYYSRIETKITGLSAKRSGSLIPILRLGIANVQPGEDIYHMDYASVIDSQPSSGAREHIHRVLGPRILRIQESSSTRLVTVLGVVEFGKGLIVVDGTGLMGGYRKFRDNEYDWPRFYQNLLGYSKAQ